MKHHGSIMYGERAVYDFAFTPASLGVELRPLRKGDRKPKSLAQVESAIRTHYGQNAQRTKSRKKNDR